MKKYALIVAGGTGKRMNSTLPKQFHLLNDKPLLYFTLRSFLDAYDDMQIILVLPEEFVAVGQEIIDAYFDYSRIQIAIGGRQRFHSVQNGLALVEDESIVMVHDAVRCLVTPRLIQRCYEAVLEHGSAIPVIQCKDSIRIVNEEGNQALDRNALRLVQTPQAFYSKIILPAFKIDYKEWFTDEASVTEAFGLKLHLVEGEEENIKVTHPMDMLLAQAILNSRSS
ncbi:MAG TPA: 2-C-methyl-D-erythritol 4-phosphate cytidylyltransferase [Ferruginibacter sp.]|nr:2-C-methyl-D-erythritol 4-phosphate cytidylyltransferase [Ferruginibacter sp.]HRN79863.1 2-C-methyl-D-erythritol 4-phosphate cytidylyltransferase [Ferruginibacter sp.]HRO17525.1 2-C-methyl-D-erythritol 4-phosphate cytidylyltransferase [Ferruginibacter sp.]HRQ20972.1 2-C-methyl-D-erythritol 4-phosphate cytidylyltransferase [Ferruginibacter sp.]